MERLPAVEPDRSALEHSAVAKTLCWAEEAAAEHEYADALYFLSVVRDSGVPLTPTYVEKQRAWSLAARNRARPSP